MPDPLALDELAWPALTPQRIAVIDALVALSADEDAAARVLKLSAGQRGEIAVNASIRTGATLSAIDRYTGVLFDALDAASLDARSRTWLSRHVMIHSAPFGPVGALDRIPAYRLGANASIPALPALRRVWSDPVAQAIAEAAPSFVLDLRSEAYVALGAVPESIASIYVRVVSERADGTARALNHFNKHAKGDLVRALAQSRPRVGTLRAFRRWAAGAGVRVQDGAAGEIELVV